MLYLKLFWEFFKTGLFAVGGGMATLPFLYDISDRTGWFTHEQLADMIAISESTPGPIGVNMATYAGKLTAGYSGAVAATLGLITPSIIIILIIAAFLEAFRKNKYVDSIFYGMRPASTAMITAACLLVAKIVFIQDGRFLNVNWDSVDLAVLLLMFTHSVKFTKKFHPVIWIALSAVIGVIFKY